MKQKVLSILVLCVLLVGVTYAQNREITGKVTSSSDGSPIAGVSVSAVGTTVGTQTDEGGNYTLTLTEPATELSFSYIGYSSQRVSISNQTVINVQLVRNDEALDEVVVTALGISRDKKSLGYASQEVKGDVLNAARGGNPLQSLSGNVAGAVIN